MRSIIPALRYRDGHRAIDWLCTAFGFEQHLVVPDDDGGIAHAQLVRGNVMIMLGSSHEGEYGKVVKSPSEIDGFNTQSPYVVVEDPGVSVPGFRNLGSVRRNTPRLNFLSF